MLKILLTTTAILATVLPANAHEEKSDKLTITHPWTRATAPSQKVGVVFMEIETTTGKADRLLFASSPDAEKVEIHGHTREGDIMRMRRLESGIEVPAKGSVKLAPGNFHIMLIGLTAPLLEETTIPLMLTFKNGGTVSIEAVVESAGSGGSSAKPMTMEQEGQGADKDSMKEMNDSEGFQGPGASK